MKTKQMKAMHYERSPLIQDSDARPAMIPSRALRGISRAGSAASRLHSTT